MTKFITKADKWQKWRDKWNSGRRDEQQNQVGGLMTKMVKQTRSVKVLLKTKSGFYT